MRLEKSLYINYTSGNSDSYYTTLYGFCSSKPFTREELLQLAVPSVLWEHHICKAVPFVGGTLFKVLLFLARADQILHADVLSSYIFNSVKQQGQAFPPLSA